jgi:hypothetical protein
MQKRACHWRVSQRFTGAKVTHRQYSSRFWKKTASHRGRKTTGPPGAPERRQGPLLRERSTARDPRQKCPPPGEGIFCLLFVAAWTKSKAGCGRSARGLAWLCLDKPGKKPGVSPPDCDILFCWLKRVCRKEPATGVDHACSTFSFINPRQCCDTDTYFFRRF